jgi:DNA-binding transcriptional MerR regulator
MELLSVGEMARRSGVPATTLRYYDTVGLLEPIRLTNNHRRYPATSVRRLQLIRMCQELGCGLDEIRGLLRPDAAEERRSVARRELERIALQFELLTAARGVLAHYADCACTDRDDCRAIAMRGVDEWERWRSTLPDRPLRRRAVDPRSVPT